jgi:hypothetical protein
MDYFGNYRPQSADHAYREDVGLFRARLENQECASLLNMSAPKARYVMPPETSHRTS